MPEPLTFRLASPGDSDAVARLHAASWRAHYRGSLTDAYLDGPIEEERRHAWSERLGTPDNTLRVLLAERNGALEGFACAFVGKDGVEGTLIDNLHVARDHKSSGTGRALMRTLAERLVLEAPDRPVHLFVKEANVAAQGFYKRIGGEIAGREIHDGPDGSRSPVFLILWQNPAALLKGTEST